MALKKSKDKVLAGVCGGVAEALGFDKTLVRIIWAILVLFAGTGLILYLLLWILMPSK
jgi:phage shock protein PspC (stress-responsive transcriptional regulator)